MPRVLELWAALMANGYAADPRFRPVASPIEAIRDYAWDVWLRSDPFPHVLVAEVDGQVVGFVHGLVRPYVPVLEQPPVARIGDVWVDVDFRRRGLGKALVEAFVERAKAAGYPWIEVGTLTADEQAVAFWKSVGFGDFRVVFLREESG